jgi:hypothetical protein
MDIPRRAGNLPLPADARDRGSLDRAFPAVYDELRRLAHRKLRREADGHTLNTTALVHEANLQRGYRGGHPMERRRTFLCPGRDGHAAHSGGPCEASRRRQARGRGAGRISRIP